MTNNAINTSIPIEVTKGGTQASSFVAYAPVVGGTTSTGALQSVASAGTTGQVLVSQGASALPIWAASTGFSNVNVQTFIASGTYTPTTGMIKCIVECVGGGGKGSSTSATNANEISVGGGGGAGEYRRGLYTAATIGVSQTVTIGAGATTQSIPGGDTIFGTLITAKGGSSGGIEIATGATGSNGLQGGTGGSGGDLAIDGGDGTAGFGSAAASFQAVASGGGGASFFGGGAAGRGASGTGSTDGNNASTYGSGGGGALSGTSNATGQNGGNGHQGLVVVTEFIA